MSNYVGRHSLQTANHRLESWIYADATARMAATGFTVDDVGRVAFQQSDNSYWRLSDDAPVTWAAVISNSGATTADIDAHAAIVGTQTVAGHLSFEQIQDMIATAFAAGSGISITYDDTANTFVVSSTVSPFANPLTTQGDMIYQSTSTIKDTNYATPALGAVATASDFYAGEEPQYAIDGNEATDYSSASRVNNGRWLQIDLGQTRIIGGIRLHDAALGTLVQSHNGDNVWVTRLTIPNNPAPADSNKDYLLPPVAARYWRLYGTDPFYGFWIVWTFELYSVQAGVVTRLPVGNTNDVLSVASGLPVWQARPTAMTNPMTAAGDLIVGSGAATVVNMATGANGATAIASSFTVGHEPSKVIDGDDVTYWESATTPANSGWVGVDLGQPRTISKYRFAQVNGSSDHYLNVQSIQSADSATGPWTLRSTPISTNITGIADLDASATARYWRINPTGASGNTNTSQFFTLELYGTPAVGNPTRLPVGTVGQFLTVGATSDLGWTTPIQSAATVTKTGPYTLVATDGTVYADATSSSFTLTLPNAAGNTGRTYTFKRMDANPTTLVTIAAAGGQFIDGDPSLDLDYQYEYLTVQSNGTGWSLVGD